MHILTLTNLALLVLGKMIWLRKAYIESSIRPVLSENWCFHQNFFAALP